MKFSFVGVVLALMSLSGAMALAAPIKVTEVEGVTEYRLDNGLRVLLAPDVSKPTITVNVTYMVGSRHEGYGETGMAHLLEHMLFKGTPSISNLPLELSRRGMRPNGMTSYDRTQYFETFSANDSYLDWALGMEADRMVHANVAEKDLRSEMTVVRNEMERGENSPDNVLREKVLAAAYQWHNYGRSVIGARSDVENVGIGNLQAFYRRYYQPDNAVLTIAGKFDSVRTLALVEKKFAPIARPSRVLPPSYTIEPPQEGERSVRLERLGENRILDVVYHVPAGPHPDSTALDIFMDVMSDTPTGRLHKALVQTGKATSVYAWGADLHDPGFVIYSAQLRKQDSPEAVRKILIDTLEGVAQHPITEAEVDASRRSILVGFEKTINDTSSLAMALSTSIAQGDWRLFFWQRDRFSKVSAEEVNQVARKYYRAANRTSGEFVPVDTATRVEIPALPDLSELLKGYTGSEVKQAGEAFDPSPDNIEKRTQTFKLDNGMQLALLPKKNRGGTVNVSLLLNMGTEETLRGQAEAAVYTAKMLMRGSKTHDREAIARELDRLRSQIYINGSGQNVYITVESVRENLPATLRLLREILREPAFSSTEFEQITKQMRSAIESARIEPDSLADQALARHFNAYPQDDIRYAKTFPEQLLALDHLKLSDLQQFHARFYGADHAQMAVVGDFDAEEIRQLTAGLFGDWKSREIWQRIRQPFVPVIALKDSQETPDKQNAVLRAGLRIPVGADSPDYPALQLASNIIGGGFISSRLADRLRQKEGISYNVGASYNASRTEQSGFFSVYAIYAPQYRARAELALREELTRVVEKGFTAEELQDAKNGLLQNCEMNRAQDGSLSYMLAANLNFGQDWQRVRVLEDKIRQLTLAEVNAAAAKYIRPDNVSLFFAGDFAGAQKK